MGLTRRSFLGAAAGLYGVALGLSEAAIPNVFDGSAFKLKAPEPHPKHGGILRYGVLSAPAHFDVHQSGTVSNMGTQGCMYDNLVRRNPLDGGQTIIPDLAHSWEIDKDGKTYTFFLRKGVTFHDGADFTAEDVKATYIDANIRQVQISVWFDDAQEGNFDLTMSAIVSTLLDPSDYFNAWYRKGAPQNYSRWHNATFETLVDKIDRELDETKRKALIRQADAIMEQDPPLLPVSWERINDAWYRYVKGHRPENYFGIYDVVRFDTFWMDK